MVARERAELQATARDVTVGRDVTGERFDGGMLGSTDGVLPLPLLPKDYPSGRQRRSAFNRSTLHSILVLFYCVYNQFYSTHHSHVGCALKRDSLAYR